ncbi:MAG: biotin--[acetyl-CoA-carboxylase] ligase [Desulfobulbaceae bacterium]|nr:biotin--[acetyl-CoA-carboxylase] ligase [Desulfobulbaceae bacterium]
MESTNKDQFWQHITSIESVAGHPLVIKDETVSTNTDALDLAIHGSATGTVVIAKVQTGGRGRLGKTWISPSGGGLYFSMILRPRLDISELPQITLAAGVALCRAIARHCESVPMLKWPNDLLLSGRKCAGILTESHLGHGSEPVVVLGIGLNVSTPLSFFPPDLQKKLTSLEIHCPGVDMTMLFTSLLEEVDSIMARMENGEFGVILDEWRLHDATRGKRLSWVTADRRIVTGISLGPDDSGRLHIRDDRGQVFEVLSGDIQLLSP